MKTLVIAKIRRALGIRSNPPDLPSLPERKPAGKELLKTFAGAIERAGGEFLDLRGDQALVSGLEHVLREASVDRIVWENCALLRRHSIPAVFAREETIGGLCSSEHPARHVLLPLSISPLAVERQDWPAIELTVSSAAFGIAETGSLLNQAAQSGRILPVLPPNHLVLVREKNVLPGLADLFQIPGLVSGSSTSTLVTGPSRTADIEKILVTGVHGPKRLFVGITV